MNESEFSINKKTKKERLAEQLRQFIKNQIDLTDLSEGLLYTKSVEIASKSLNNIFKNENIKTTKDYDYNRIIVDVTYIELNKLNFLMSVINNLGYFISVIDVFNKNKQNESFKFSEGKFYQIINKKSNYNKIELILEAKFDILVSNSEYMFHVTNKNKISKILKNGLVPKSNSKTTYHPERIYVTKTIKDAEMFALNLKNKKPNDMFVIIGIETQFIPHIKIFDDPNFKLQGYYTLTNIPPNALFFVKEI